MDNINDIKAQLDNFYQEYKDNKNTLNGSKTKAVSKLIVDLVSSKDGTSHDGAMELARFSAEVSAIFFETLIKNKILPLTKIEDVLEELLATDTDPKLSQYYVSKYSSAIVLIIKCYKNEAYQSSILPKLVIFMARFAIKSDKNKNKFYNLINNSAGEIFKLNYTSISKDSLVNIWNAVNNIYPDLTKATYVSLIREWAVKYSFITASVSEEQISTDNKMKIEESVVAKEAPAAVQTQDKAESVNTTPENEEPKASVTDTAISEKEEKLPIVTESTKADMPADKPAASTDEKASNHTSDTAASEKAPDKKGSVQILYERLKRDMNKEQEAIITAIVDKIKPISKAVSSIQGEISQSRELGIENATLKAKNEELERQLGEMRTRLQENSQSLSSARVENSDLKQQVASLECKVAELDNKLNDAYSINSRESSLEAEKVRSELKNAISFLYEDWLEYEFSDVSEENYESLQAIIKKIFRSLERNGIDFKGND